MQIQNEDERQQQLRERARRLIAEVKMGVAVTPNQLNDDNNSDRRSIDDQNNSPRRSITPSTPGDRLSIKVLQVVYTTSSTFSTSFFTRL